MKANLILDLDQCLIDTSQLRDYRKTDEGLTYSAQHMNDLPTELVHPALLEIVTDFHRNGRAYILTNAAEQYAINALRKHGFPEGLRVYANAKKPMSAKLNRLLQRENIAPKTALIIDDEAKGILTAHGSNVCSVGVSWGHSSEEQLEAAEATRVIDNAERLERLIKRFEAGKIGYEPRNFPNEFLKLSKFNIEVPEITYVNTGGYIPFRSPTPQDIFSKQVLRCKNLGELTLDQLNEGTIDRFFYNGQFRGNDSYLASFWVCSNRVKKKLKEMNLEGETLIVPAPNSAPGFCYKMDPNVIFTVNAFNELSGAKFTDRMVHRVYPKPKKTRHSQVQYQTLGLKQMDYGNPNNIVIFDDILTGGSQIKAVAAMLKHFGVDGKFYALTIGKTV